MSRLVGVALVGVALVIGATAARATEAPRLDPGAVEIGLAASLTSVDGSTRATVAGRCGSFVATGSALIGFEAEVAYAHDRSLDGLGVEGALSWQHRVGSGPVYPLASVGGGARWESVGSFRQTRYPLGFGLGVRALIGMRAAVRVEYRFRRVMHDPVADFNEHQVVTGLSLLFRNPRIRR